MTPPWTKEGFFFCFYLFCSGSLKCRSRLSPKCSHYLRQMKLVPITTSDQETLRIILMFKSCINYLLHDFHDDAFTSAPSRLWLPHIHSFHVFEPRFYSICSVDAVLNTTILIVCTSVCRWQLYSMLSLLYQTVFYFFFYCTFSKDSAPTFTVNPMAVGGGSICASITCFFFFFPLAGCFTVAVLPPTVRIINILTTTVAAVFSPCCSLVLRAQASSFHITFFLYKFLFCM